MREGQPPTTAFRLPYSMAEPRLMLLPPVTMSPRADAQEQRAACCAQAAVLLGRAALEPDIITCRAA
eukprot:3700877-Alexandrium_andersonii.AAC.1